MVEAIGECRTADGWHHEIADVKEAEHEHALHAQPREAVAQQHGAQAGLLRWPHAALPDGVNAPEQGAQHCHQKQRFRPRRKGPAEGHFVYRHIHAVGQKRAQRQERLERAEPMGPWPAARRCRCFGFTC